MRILHASFLVSDLDAAHEFYGKLLGLEVEEERPELGFPGRWYGLESGQQIHLLMLPDPARGKDLPEHGGRDRHVAFSVKDLDELSSRLDQAKIPFTLSRSGRRALFCRDPDGNALEFVET
ncbi:MAG TPA: VOC family protein [Burkholderiales bacterium]|nr:VOC family protein [Burkholderiales bacterium]